MRYCIINIEMAGIGKTLQWVAITEGGEGGGLGQGSEKERGGRGEEATGIYLVHRFKGFCCL